MAIKNFFSSKNESQDNGFNSDYYGNTEKEKSGDDFGYGAACEQNEVKTEAPRQTIKKTPDFMSTCSMKLMKPTSYDDSSAIAEALMANNAVILNLENTNAETASNLIYFLGGVTYAIRGQLKQVSTNTYMLTPKNISITEEEEESSPAAEEPETPVQGFGYQGYGSGYRG